MFFLACYNWFSCRWKSVWGGPWWNCVSFTIKLFRNCFLCLHHNSGINVADEFVSSTQRTAIVHHCCCDWRKELSFSNIRKNSKRTSFSTFETTELNSGLMVLLLQVTLSGGMLFIIFGIQSFLTSVEWGLVLFVCSSADDVGEKGASVHYSFLDDLILDITCFTQVTYREQILSTVKRNTFKQA